MFGTIKTIKFTNLTVDGRQQRVLLGGALLALNIWRTDWITAGLPDYLATSIQLELILTGFFGWCPFMFYKLRKNKKA